MRRNVRSVIGLRSTDRESPPDLPQGFMNLNMN